MSGRKQIRQTDKRTGRVYVYETEYRYDKSKKRTVLHGRKLVGHIDPEAGSVVPNRDTKPYQSSPKSTRQFYGATYLFDRIAEISGIAADLREAAPELADKALSLAYYLTSEGSCPISRFNRWSRTHAHPYGMEISSQRGSELFAALDQDVKERFCALQAKRRPEGQYWYYDATSISSWSETLRQVKWGHNKDRVPLPQINLACLIGQQSGLPFYFRNYAGNISDVSTIQKLIDDVAYMGMGKARIACDRGFWSSANINALMDKHIKFLIGVKTGLKFVARAIKDNASKLRQWQNYDGDRGVFGLAVPHEWDFEKPRPGSGETGHDVRRSYLYVYYSPSRVADDERELAVLLKSLSAELESGNMVESHSGLYEHYFERVRGKWVGRMDVIEAQRETFGYFALFGNDAKLDAAAALAIYRQKDIIEKSFADIKDRLDFRTPKASSTETLNGKIFCVFVALIITSWLRKKMSDTGLDKKWTLQGLIDELDVIERYTSAGKSPKVVEVTKKQKDIYSALGFEAPNAS